MSDQARLPNEARLDSWREQLLQVPAKQDRAVSLVEDEDLFKQLRRIEPARTGEVDSDLLGNVHDPEPLDLAVAAWLQPAWHRAYGKEALPFIYRTFETSE